MAQQFEILLVTDDDELGAEIVAILETSALDVARVRSGDEALEVQKDEKSRLILIDSALGDDVAVTTCAELRAGSDSALGILVMVSGVGDLLVSQLIGAGADDVMSRRLKKVGFLARVAAQLRRLETVQELDRKVRDSHTLIEITSRLVGVGDLFENLYAMAYLLSEELEVDRCSVVLVRSERDLGLVIASSDDPEIKDLLIDLSRYPEIQQVALEARPLVVSDVNEAEILEDVLPRLKDARVSSVALFPIVDNDRVLGVIFLRFADLRSAFEQRELIFCQTVANATAIALRNNEILESLRAKTQEVEQVQNEARSKLAALKPYENFFHNSADGMVVLSDSGVVLFVNPEGATILGRNAEEIRGVPFTDFLAASEWEMLETLIEERTQGLNRTIDFTRVASNMAVGIIALSAGNLGDEGMLLLTMREVTDERMTSRRLHEAQERLIENEKQTAMMEVAGAAAHELNQPLTSVLTSLAMLRRLSLDMPDRTARVITTMESEIERMAAIIRRLSKLTEYATKAYVGGAKIIDLERAFSGDEDTEEPK